MSDDESIDNKQDHDASEHDAKNDDELAETDEFDSAPPTRRRRRPLVITAVIVLIVILVGGGLALSRAVSGGAFGPASTPTATLLPGENLYYITTNPAWGTVSVDGHSITHLPALGEQPLELPTGGHTIVWNTPPLPPQKCLIFVPPQQTASGACSTSDVMTVQSGKDTGLQATVVEFTLTPSMLSSAQLASLDNVVQTLFNTLQASDTVQPGELYVDFQASHDAATAAQPLKATFTLHLDTNQNSHRPCYGAIVGTGQLCSNIGGQSCYTFCNSSLPDLNELPRGFSYPPTWDVYAVSYVSWDYTTLGGQNVAANQPDTAPGPGSDYLMPLFISWTGAQ